MNGYTDVDLDEHSGGEKDEYPGVRVGRITIKKIWGRGNKKGPVHYYKIFHYGASKLLRAIKMYA